jgi:hypothetical protein
MISHGHGKELLGLRKLNWFHERLPQVHVELPCFRSLVAIRLIDYGEGDPHVLQQALVACQQLDALLSDERLLPLAYTDKVSLLRLPILKRHMWVTYATS